MDLVHLANTANLEECERVIARGAQTFMEVGTALQRIRDGRLYLDTHENFPTYCKDRWGFSDNYAHKLVAAASVARVVDADLSERAARELTGLDKREVKAVVEKAREIGDGQLTAGTIRKAKALTRPAPDESEPSVLTGTDPFGLEVPPELHSAVNDWPREFDALGRDINKLLGRIENLAGHESRIGDEIDIAFVRQQLKDVRRSVLFAAPHCVCPDWSNCKDGCKKCKGKGWLTEQQGKTVHRA